MWKIRRERDRENKVIVHYAPDPKHLSAFRPIDGATRTSAS